MSDKTREEMFDLRDPGAAAPYDDSEGGAGRLKQGVLSGLSKGWSGFVWMLKILIPISFLTMLLEWSGWLRHLDFLIEPIMGILGLPAMAALPLIIGMLTGVYGGIAAMVVLPFSPEEMTLMAIFILIAHNLIQEGVIQGKSGLNPIKATVFRLGAAAVTVVCAAQFLGPTSAAAQAAGGVASAAVEPFLPMLRTWGLEMLHLSLKIFLIIMSIMILLEVLKALDWIKHIVRLLSPFLKALGLSRGVGILWMAAVVFGLAYGAAVIVEEAKRGDLSKDELETLHLSIGINHSMIEDPILFLSLGLSAFWLWVPRLVTAVIAVRLLSFWHRRSRRAQYFDSSIR